MNEQFVNRVQAGLKEIEAAGLFKQERIITSEQGHEIQVNGKTVLNFCANNYLGLSSHSRVIEAGFDIKPGDHPIMPIMLCDAVTAQKTAAGLLEEVSMWRSDCLCCFFNKKSCLFRGSFLFR